MQRYTPAEIATMLRRVHGFAPDDALYAVEAYADRHHLDGRWSLDHVEHLEWTLLRATLPATEPVPGGDLDALVERRLQVAINALDDIARPPDHGRAHELTL